MADRGKHDGSSGVPGGSGGDGYFASSAQPRESVPDKEEAPAQRTATSPQRQAGDGVPMSSAAESFGGALIAIALLAFVVSLFQGCGGACGYDGDASAVPALLAAVVMLVVGVIIVNVDASTESGKQREAARKAEQARQLAGWNEQLDRWGYDSGTVAHSWPPQGFATYDVLAGSAFQGHDAPAWSKLHLELAPPGKPTLAARVAPHQPGPAIDIPVSDLVRLQARSRSGAWFGFGASGAMAAHAASALDYHLAGYELNVVSRSGFNLRLRMLGGAPPVAKLQLVEARMQGVAF